MSRATIAPPADPPTTAAPGPHSIHGAVPIFIIFFFLIGFLSIYLLRDLVEYLASALPGPHGGGVDGGSPAEPRRWGGSRGLDPESLAALPVRRYSSLKGLRQGVEPETECAVCIAEFDDDDPVRLLTSCRHTFHQSCIDQWLASHPTCPVCRCDLRELPVTTPKAGQAATVQRGREEAEQP